MSVTDRYSRDQHNLIHIRRAPAVPVAAPMLYMVPKQRHAWKRYRPLWLVRVRRQIATLTNDWGAVFVLGVMFGLIVAILLT